MYLYDASATRGQVEIVDSKGNVFRIDFDRQEGGFIVTKVDGDVTTVSINPIVSNQVRIK